MIGEISIGGVYVPSLLVLLGIAVVVTALLSRLFSAIGLYRYVAYRPLVDVALIVVVLGAAAFLTQSLGVTR